jgi:hypothetical protein
MNADCRKQKVQQLSLKMYALFTSASALGAAAPAENLERAIDISAYARKRLDELHGGIAKEPVQQASQ